MGASLAPSRYILQKAWKLGQKMAYKERRLVPDVAGAHQYANFSLFRTIHRHRLEEHPAFLRWEEKLEELIEREASGRGFPLDDSKQWETFERYITTPIRSSFWYGWELVHELEKLYRDETEQFQAHAKRKQVLRVYKAPARPAIVPSALPEGDELRHWDAMAEKLFEQMDGDRDERLWDMPNANQVLESVRSQK